MVGDGESHWLAGDLRRDVEVSHGQIDHVSEWLEMAKATGSILDDLDDSVEAFCDRVGHSGFDEGEDAGLVARCGGDESAQRLEAAT